MRTHFLPAVSFAALLVSAAAQQPAPPRPAALAAQPSGATFTSNANLVIVDVKAKDKNGVVIEGLKAGDFTVLEDNKPQKISIFEFQKITTEPEPPETLQLSDQLKLPEAPKTEITATNPGKIEYHNKRMLVFFFDFSSMAVPDQLRAQAAALEYLEKRITKDDMVAVLFYASMVQVLSDFTDDRDMLTHIIQQLPIGEASELAGLADTDDTNGEDTQAAFVADETEFNIFNTDQKLAAIETAAKMLKNFPEEKALVYFSGGVTRTGLDNEAQLQASINAATKANLAIYSIDCRGLMANPPGGDASHAGSRGSGIFTGAVVNSQRASQLASQDTLYNLATETGGKAFFDTNDIAGSIARTQLDMSSYYLLGYYSTNPALDGKYRKITVKLNNPKLAAKLEHREGYWADKTWNKLGSQDKEQALKEAMAAGDPITDLPLALRVDYFRISPTAYFVPVSIKFPGSVVGLAVKGGASVTQFDFAGQIQDERHAVVGNVRDNIQIKLNQETAAQATRKNYQYDAGFTLEPGKYRMKFVVRENLTGKMGTFETSFTVPDLAADTSGLKTSTVIWSSQREAVTAAVGSAERFNQRLLRANPLIVGNEKVIPNITHVFRRSQSLYVNFDVYDAQPDPANARARRVKVEMSLFNNDNVKTFEIGPIAATQVAQARPEAVPVQFQIPLQNIARGSYMAQINVVDEVGRKFTFQRAKLVIE